MLRATDLSHDARVVKQATALRDAGAEVVLVGVGDSAPDDLVAMGFDVRMVPPKLRGPRLGREDVWWALRVAVNLTYTRALQYWRETRPASRTYLFGNALLEAARDVKPDVVHAYNIHTLPAAVELKRQGAVARIVYDVRDLFSDESTPGPEFRRRLRIVETKLIGEVDSTITVCETFADVLAQRYGISRPTVVYNGPIEVKHETNEVSTPIRLLFQGILRSDRRVGWFVDAMTALRNRAVLTIQGFGGVEQELRKQVERLDLEDVVLFVPPAPAAEVVDAAARHDIGVVYSTPESLNIRLSVPNKLMDYLGAGLAIVASDTPGHRSVLEGTGAAVFIDPSSPSAVAEGVSRLLDDPELVSNMKVAALKAAEKYVWDVQAEKLLGVYEAVIGRSPSR